MAISATTDTRSRGGRRPATRYSAWRIPALPEVEVASLARALHMGLPAARVLWARGYREPERALRFMQPQLDDLHDPYLLRDMRPAARRLAQAIRTREKVLLYGDYDVDGTMSLVLLKKAIELAGGQAEFHVPHRLREGYGMRTEVVAQKAADGTRLVVSVDTGIRAGAVVQEAVALGLDVIITDHHLPEAELPPALAVVNPNRPDCHYPEKNLCGAGVAFKLVQATLQELGWPEDRLQRLTESFLKLVALATVADVVPLTGENRIIVTHGLAGLADVRNPGLRALMRVAGFNEGATPTAGQVAFRIAPRINAAGRMEEARDVVELFLTSNARRADQLASQLHELNQDRQQTELDILERILEECSRQPVDDGHAALVFCGPEWHRGVVGIVASRMVDRYHRPVFVLSEENGVAQGSGRSIEGFHLLEALEAMPDLFTRFGGHKQAAGVTLPAERVPEFRDQLNLYASARLTPLDFCHTLAADAVLELRELDDEAAAQVRRLAPFGMGNPAPVFVLRGVTISGEPVIFGERHLRLRLQQGRRHAVAKAWDFAERRGEFSAGTVLDLAVSVDDDHYSQSGWGLTVKDARRVE